MSRTRSDEDWKGTYNRREENEAYNKNRDNSKESSRIMREDEEGKY